MNQMEEERVVSMKAEFKARECLNEDETLGNGSLK